MMSRLKYIPALTLFILSVFINPTFGNNLEITNVTYDEVSNSLNFDISWDNAFRISDTWFDHVYIFAKYKNANGSSWESVIFEFYGHSDNNPDMIFASAYNSVDINGGKLGVDAFHQTSFTFGTQGGNCTAIMMENNDFIHPSFKVFGIEMVRMSNQTGNDYYLGDGISANRWHRGDDTTQSFLWVEGSAATVNVGNGPFDINTTHPDGIPVSSIAEHNFRAPNNIMKYEISQIQYVEFLNTLNRTAQNNRVGTDISGTAITNVYVCSQTPNVANFTRNGIRCDAILPNGGPITFFCDYNGNGIPNEYDDGQNIAMNYLSGKDLFAFLDWAGMEPLNEMEYEQACRGSSNSVPNEFAWGTSGYTYAVVNLGATNGSPDEFLNGAPVNGPIRTSQLPMRCGTAATATTNRVTSGASAYGIMELSGNACELVVALRTANSFNTPILNSDGALDNFGNSDEPWPEEIIYKGGFISNDAQSVSFRKETSIPFTARSAFYGGRGGY